MDSCHCCRARPQIAEAEDFRLTRRVADSTAESRQGWSYSLGVGQRSTAAVHNPVCVWQWSSKRYATCDPSMETAEPSGDLTLFFLQLCTGWTCRVVLVLPHTKVCKYSFYKTLLMMDRWGPKHVQLKLKCWLKLTETTLCILLDYTYIAFL